MGVAGQREDPDDIATPDIDTGDIDTGDIDTGDIDTGDIDTGDEGPDHVDERHDRLVDLGAFIRSQRELTRMSVRKLADVAGVSNPYLSQIERGIRRPSADILQQLAEALRISVETLYVRAGILQPNRGHELTVVEAIERDAVLSPEQKQALINVYTSFVNASS